MRARAPSPMWTLGPVIVLLLDEQARSHLDFPADAERVDALIAGRAVAREAERRW